MDHGVYAQFAHMYKYTQQFYVNSRHQTTEKTAINKTWSPSSSFKIKPQHNSMTNPSSLFYLLG